MTGYTTPPVAVADFRTPVPTGVWWTSGITLTSAEIADAALAALIESKAEEFDLYTADHFEPEPATGTTTVDVSVYEPKGRLFLPKRIRTLTQVATRGTDGTLTVQPATAYRVIASLVGGVRQQLDEDYIEIIEGESVLTGQFLSTGYPYWPLGIQTVQLTGTFSWPVCPDDVKRAISLMVWEVVRPIGDYMREAGEVTVDGAVVKVAQFDGLSRVVEAQDIGRRYTRQRVAV